MEKTTNNINGYLVPEDCLEDFIISEEIDITIRFASENIIPDIKPAIAEILQDAIQHYLNFLDEEIYFNEDISKQLKKEYKKQFETLTALDETYAKLIKTEKIKQTKA